MVEKPTATTKEPLSFTALREEGSLDPLMYHRGREGEEHRRETDGALLCDAPHTDTNAGKEGPPMVTTVVVAFDLGNDCQFQETVEWDLVNSMSPMEFGEQLADQFGLAYEQVLEVVDSIDYQLQQFVRQHASYCQPVATKNALGQPNEGHPGQAPLLFGPPRPAKAKAPVRVPAVSRPERRGSARKSSGVVEHVFEVQVRQRLLQKSRERFNRLQDTRQDFTKIRFDASQCHLCVAVGTMRCGIFGCGVAGHAYCLEHLKEKLSLEESSKELPDHCPICSLSCQCVLCTRTVELVSVELKNRCGDASPDTVAFDDIVPFSRQCTSQAKKSKKVQRKTTRRRVPKAPVSCFPREVCQGLDVDPGSPMDYQTIFTSKGPVLPRDDSSPFMKEVELSAKENVEQPEDPTVVVEDGSVDFCNKCRKHGNLLCCDYCPRAFHADCINANLADLESDAPWECPACVDEKKGLPRDQMTGSRSLPIVCAAFDDLCASVSESNLESLRVLAILHEMIQELIQYDFGYVFSHPVDLKAIPTYTKYVRKPMDLGTIASRIVNGQYNGKLGEGSNSLDETVVAVLKDIELVWHNCFTFNCEGSAVYRMAEVQRRRAAQVRRVSFEQLLSPFVREELMRYISFCKRSRTTVGKNSKYRAPDFGRHKLSLPKVINPKRRAVAVLQPESGRPVKFYSSVESAAAAVVSLLKLKLACEWDDLNTETDTKVRKLIKQGTSDPNVHLFGYRWLYVDQLHGGKVTFDSLPVKTSTKRRPVDLIELRVGDFHASFRSAKEALSQPGLFGDLGRLGKELGKLATGDRLLDDCGRSWRRQILSQDDSVESEASSIAGSTHITSGAAVRSAPNEDPVPEGVKYVKRDLISGALLSAFPTARAAYEDYLLTVEGSPVPHEPLQIDKFESDFLCGGGNVSGVVWRARKRTSPLDPRPGGSKGSASVGKPSLGLLKSLKEES